MKSEAVVIGKSKPRKIYFKRVTVDGRYVAVVFNDINIEIGRFPWSSKTNLNAVEREKISLIGSIGGFIETHIRYGWSTSSVKNGPSDMLSGRGSAALVGEVSLREALNLTNPESFYRAWDGELAVREKIIRGELYLLPGSGIYYQLQRAVFGSKKKMVTDSSRTIRGKEMLKF